MPQIIKIATAPAVMAALSLVASPSLAADFSSAASSPSYGQASAVQQIEDAGKAENRRHHRYRHRRGPGVGDVIAGVLIIGAIAQVAKAATRDDRGHDYRRDVRYDDTRGIDRAVDMCVEAIERERRVETVDRVDRAAQGWMVEGTVMYGDRFNCRIGDDGRGLEFDIEGRNSTYGRGRDYAGDYDDTGYSDNREGELEDRQWDDDRYASERRRVDNASGDNVQPVRPSYPGGPLPGDDADVEGDLEIGTGYPGV